MGTANSDEGSKLKAIIKLGVQCGLVSGFELCRLRGVSRGLCEWIANQTELWHLLCVTEWPNTRATVIWPSFQHVRALQLAYDTGLFIWSIG
jgi:hypothetical protein